MDADDYIEGTPIKVRAVQPGDQVWINDHPVTITEVRWCRGDRVTLVHAGGRYDAAGVVILPRTQRRMDAQRGSPQQDMIVDLGIEIVELKAKLEARDLELAECADMHEHDGARITELERELAQYRKRGVVNVKDLVNSDTRVRNLEALVREQDRTIVGMRKNLVKLHTTLDEIKHLAHPED